MNEAWADATRSAAAAYVDSAAFTLVGADRAGIIVALHGLSGARDQTVAYLDGADLGSLGLLAPDLRAHGGTELLGDPQSFTPRQLAADVTALIGSLGLACKPLVLVGVSLGATVSLEIVRGAALDVVAAVFVRPAHAAAPAPHLRLNRSIAEYLRDDPGQALARLVASEEYRAVASVSERAAASLRQKVTAERAAERAMRLEKGASWTAFVPSERLEDAPPTLVVAALDDPLHPRAVAREWQRRIGGCRLAELPSRDADPEAYLATARATIHRFLAPHVQQLGTAG